MALSIDTIPNACRQANKPAIRLRHAGSEPGARETAHPEDDDRQSFASQSTPYRRLSHGAEGWNRLAEPGRVDDRPPILSARACGTGAGLETRHVPEIIRGHRRTQSWNAPGSRDRHRQ